MKLESLRELEDDPDEDEEDDDDDDSVKIAKPEQKLVRTVVNKKVDNRVLSSDESTSDPDVDSDEEDDDIPIEIVKPEKKLQRKKLDLERKVFSLEDLYSIFPDLGDGSGDYWVRIIRDWPKSMNGQNIHGHLQDITERVSLDWIKSNYGGGKYTVSVIGPSQGKPNANGSPRHRQLKSFQVTLPGPAVPHVPVPGGEAMTSTFSGTPMIPLMPQGMPVAPQSAPQVQMKQIEVQERRENRETEAKDLMVRQASEFSQRSLEHVSALAEKHNQDLRQQLAESMRSGIEKDKLIQELYSKVASAQASETLAVRSYDESKSQKEQLQHELTRSKEDIRSRLEENDRRYREQLDEIRRQFDMDKSRIERDSSSERERIREESRSREQGLRDENERRLNSLKDSYEGRIQDITRNADRDMASVREQRDREIRSLEQTTTSEIKSSKSASDLKISLLETENIRVMTEFGNLKKELKDLQVSTHKDPRQYLTEVREMATEVLGLVPASENAVSGEEELDWKKMAAKGIMDLVGKAPEILGQVGQMRAQGQQQQMIQNQRRQQQQQRRPMLPPPQPWQQPQVASAAQPMGIVAPMRPMMQTPPQQPPGPPMAVPQPPAQAYLPDSLSPIVLPGSAPSTYYNQPPQSQPEQPQVAQQQVQAQESTSKESQAQIVEFIDQLNSSIKNKEMISPSMFANGIVNRIGPDKARELLEKVKPEDLFTLLENHDTEITTRDGQQYTRSVWSEAKSILG